jgi:hypothetical protein
VPRAVVRVRIVTGLVAALAVVGAVVVVASTRAPQPSLDAFCQEMANARELDQALATLDPDQLEPGIAALQRAAHVAPDEVAPDVETVLDLTATIQRAIVTTKTGKPEAVERSLRDQAGALPRVEAAGRALQDYTAGSCGLQLTSTG